MSPRPPGPPWPVGLPPGAPEETAAVIHSPPPGGARLWRDPRRLRTGETSRQEGTPVDDNDQLETSAHAAAAREHVYCFNRASMWARDQIPAQTSEELAEF